MKFVINGILHIFFYKCFWPQTVLIYVLISTHIFVPLVFASVFFLVVVVVVPQGIFWLFWDYFPFHLFSGSQLWIAVFLVHKVSIDFLCPTLSHIPPAYFPMSSLSTASNHFFCPPLKIKDFIFRVYININLHQYKHAL